MDNIPSRHQRRDSLPIKTSPLIDVSDPSEAHSNNPFRRRATLHLASPAPRLPSRSNISSNTPPSSSSGSGANANPTRAAPSSEIIQQSLLASRASSSNSARPRSTLEVISHSTSDKRKHSTPPLVPPRRSVESKSHSPREYRWNCADILSSRESPRYAMIILNQPITRLDSFVNAWNASMSLERSALTLGSVRICADGGANRLFDCLESQQRHCFLPQLIKGDLDSLRQDVRSYYESKGVRVVQDGDEYSTDLMKCIVEVEYIEAILRKTVGPKLY